MKKALVVLAVLAMTAAPAMADIPTTTLTHLPDAGTVGPCTTGLAAIASSFQAPLASSSSVTIDLCAHWPYVTAVNVERLRLRLVYDIGEVTVSGFSAAGVFTQNLNFSTGTVATLISGINTATSGLTNIGLFEIAVPFTTFGTVFDRVTWAGSQTLHVARITLHGEGGITPGAFGTTVVGTGTTATTISFLTAPDFFLGEAFAIFTINGTAGPLISGGGLGAVSTAVDFTPEPASASLLALGGAALLGGFWRRRRA